MPVKRFVSSSFELKPIMPRSGRSLMCIEGRQPLKYQLKNVIIAQ